MNASPPRVLILAEGAEALVQVCGISILERLLRTLQRLGVRRVTVVARDARVAAHAEARTWARAELAITVCDSAGSIDEAKTLVLAAAYYDSRLLQALLAREKTTPLIDSAPPAVVQPLLRGTGAVLCRAALLEGEWLRRLEQDEPSFEVLSNAAQRGDVDVVDASQLPGYVVDLRRTVRPLWFPAPPPEFVGIAECVVLDAAQNGTLDLPAKLHAPVETWIVARLCRTKITPMQITLFTAAVSAVVTVFFATGHLVVGTLLAFAVGILDGVDGKQARVKVETTELGKREHALDYILELYWWAALAWHFTASAQLQNAYVLLALLVLSDLVDRAAKKQLKRIAGRNLDDVAPIDRFVRLIGGRRNVYVWILAAGLALGAPDQAFVCFCWWSALTAAVHVARSIWISRQFGSSRGEGAPH